jgi:hypothetical protein
MRGKLEDREVEWEEGKVGEGGVEKRGREREGTQVSFIIIHV